MIAVCIASGPSLNAADIETARKIPATFYAVNDSHRLAPWAHVLYAADLAFWRHHHGVPEFKGERVTVDSRAAARYGLTFVPGSDALVWGDYPEPIAYGGNSGFQAINLAVQRGARRIILLGYDMGPAADGKRHWFGDHPPEINRGSAYELWIKHFEQAAPLIAARGVEIINCSRETMLTCFRRATIEEMVGHD